MGSRSTHERRKTELRALRDSPTRSWRVSGLPIGLDIGSRTPEEIAVAILAEILAVRSGRDARPLVRRRRATTR